MAKSTNSIRVNLNQDIVKRLTHDLKPVGVDHKGKLVFEPNVNGDIYTVLDASQDAPKGFGVRVNRTKRVYFVQRRSGLKVVKTNIGDCADMTIQQARERASKAALTIKDTGKNPNAIARSVEERLLEFTVGKILNAHLEHCETREEKPIRDSTKKSRERSLRRFEAMKWTNRCITDITLKEIENAFEEGKVAPTGNEQDFRWITQAVKWRVSKECVMAANEKREPVVTENPFRILALNQVYRTQAKLDRIRENNGKRNPLQPSVNLGPFLEAAWSKRLTQNNASGVNYIILMLLWGCRKSEHARLQWGELLTPQQRNETSHVWLEDDGNIGPYVFFYDTKNHLDHRLPLGPFALEILKRQQLIGARLTERLGFGSGHRKWVFPAKNKMSKTGHYANPNELLDSIRDEAGVEILTRHDLRRTFGSVLVSLGVPLGISKRFLNHKSRGEILVFSEKEEEGVTRIYTKTEWGLLQQWMKTIEDFILSKAPNVYNALKPADVPPLPAPPPHICKPEKPRTGRPKRIAVEEEAATE
jgi:integrase